MERLILLERFLTESNAIENELPPSEEQVHFFDSWLKRGHSGEGLTIQDMEEFVSVFEPSAELRFMPGQNVYIGDYFPPSGGMNILYALGDILWHTNHNTMTPWQLHIKYESLHPFTDCNGRSGRGLWAYHMNRQNKLFIVLQSMWKGFLQEFYYQTLESLHD